MNPDFILLLLAGALAALATFVVNVTFNQGHVRASSLIGLAAFGITILFSNSLSAYLSENLALVCFGASFVGMVSYRVLRSYTLIALSGALFAVLFLNMSSIFDGFGGALGATACVALLITLAIPHTIRAVKKKN